MNIYAAAILKKRLKKVIIFGLIPNRSMTSAIGTVIPFEKLLSLELTIISNRCNG